MDPAIQFSLIFVACVLLFIAVPIIAAFNRYCRSEERPIHRRAPLDLQAMVVSDVESRALLFPKGREVFFPAVPHVNAVYEITFTGVLQKDDGRQSDAFYRTDGCGNFSQPVKWLYVNGTHLSYSSTYELIASDRCTHTYKVLLDAPRERLTLSVLPQNGSEGWSGSLSVQARVLPQGTPTIAGRYRLREQSTEVGRESALVAKKFTTVIEKLCIRAELFRNWGDPEFRFKFATVHYDELMRRESEIREEASQIFEQQKIVQYLQRHNPEVLARLTGQFEALMLAERIALEKQFSLGQPQPAPQKKRLTAEEVRTIKIRRQQVQDFDLVALKLDKIETRLQVRERLANLPLDPDEREMVEQELISEIEAGGDEIPGRTL